MVYKDLLECGLLLAELTVLCIGSLISVDYYVTVPSDNLWYDWVNNSKILWDVV